MQKCYLHPLWWSCPSHSWSPSPKLPSITPSGLYARTFSVLQPLMFPEWRTVMKILSFLSTAKPLTSHIFWLWWTSMSFVTSSLLGSMTWTLWLPQSATTTSPLELTSMNQGFRNWPLVVPWLPRIAMCSLSWSNTWMQFFCPSATKTFPVLSQAYPCGLWQFSLAEALKVSWVDEFHNTPILQVCYNKCLACMGDWVWVKFL